jgi:hypothetical protein
VPFVPALRNNIKTFFPDIGITPWAGMLIGWMYPALRPVSRFMLTLFLWKSAEEKTA